MNQQRGRRFRSAKDAEKLEKDALDKGEKLPDAQRFDSNCITPGTEFMARLHEQLKYFVVSKVSTDKLWKKCKVILSGHETPGEGEHKIMDYIRYIRSQPGYDPNTRHCLYGLDADLIMLGLCTHEPHFSLLREEVKFGKKAKRSNVPEEIRFYLLHLSLMREYLELEFSPLKEQLKKSEKFEFDIEKIIDDWILMGFLVGNDFIPNLPNLQIVNGALPILYKAYMDVLPTLDGYINEAGVLNLRRFEQLMNKLADIDIKNFEETQDDLIYMKSKTGRKHTAHVPVTTNLTKNVDFDETDDIISESSCMDPALAKLIRETDDLDIESDDSENTNSDDEAFKSFKDEYYRNKMEYQKVTSQVMREQAEGYVRAIQWNLNYYYNGVCSWSWFYPHHYSPYISDVRGFSDLKIDFDLGTPFKPYEQLLAVLPPASKNLLPKCYHSLMTDDNSKIKTYYPEEFQTDLNGKRQEWEAVVLVPFIDETVLLDAMEPCNEMLSFEEAQRNTHGPMLVYNFVEECLGDYEAPEYFPKIAENHANCTPVFIAELRVPKEKLIKGAYPGACFDVFFPGFPTMKHLKYESNFEKARVKVFEQCSRNESVVLKISPNDLYFEDSIPEDLLGKTVWVGWPHLVEAKVVALSNRKEKYIFCEDEDKKYKVEEKPKSLFDSELEGVTQYYRERMGIEFGTTQVLVHVKQMIGRKYVFTSHRRVNLEKQFSPLLSHFPLQSVVVDIKTHDEHMSTFSDITDVFPPGTLCFSLTNPFYGSQGTIMEDKDTLKAHLQVALEVFEEPDFSSAEVIDRKLKNSYLTLTNAASQLALSNYAFARLTGSIYIQTRGNECTQKSVNIGLDLKFSKKNQETPGYTKKIDTTWYYSQNAVALVREYFEKFPEVIEFLCRSGADDLIASELFDEDEAEEKVKAIQHWLKTLPIHNIERRVCNSSVLESAVVEELERIVDHNQSAPKKFILQIKPHLLYKPGIQVGNLMPDPLTSTKVFDRVVNVREGFTVPLGLKGTVIAVHKPATDAGDSDEVYDVVFDRAFVGGMALNCSENRGYRLPKTSFINLSHGKRYMEQKTGVPGALRALAKERQTTGNFHSNPNKSSNNADRQQNSAFASFTMKPNYINSNFVNPNVQHNNRGYQPNQAQARSQFNPNQMSQPNKSSPGNKNSFYYMADYSRNQQVKTNKENAPGKLPDKNKQETPSSDLSQNPNTKTELLKKILKIDASSNSSSQINAAVRNPAPNFIRPFQNQTVSSTSNAIVQLLNHYQTNALGCPRYTYFNDVGGIRSQLILPNGATVAGKPAKSREEAGENVAADALTILRNNQQSMRQGPSDFPTPPVKWVEQQNKVPSQIYVNKSYQDKQKQRTQNASLPEYRKQNPSWNGNYERKREDVRQNWRDNSNGSTNFVPLQALKKKQTSRNVGNLPPTTGETERRGQNTSYETNRLIETTKENKEQMSMNRGPGRQRKMRIAANFVSDRQN